MPDQDPTAAPIEPGTSLPGRFTALLHDLAHAPTAGGGGEPSLLELRPGDVVGRFEVVGELGRGGFGVVYQARDRDLLRPVALKLLRPGLHGALGEDRLLREAEAAARLSHPNVVTLFDAGRSEHGPFLVMELLRGQTLSARLQQGPLSTDEALRIGLAIAHGLAHAHAEGIVHRDLKPANVFLTEGGGVKILDLGMAYAFGQRRLEGGTPGAMAPEQERGAPQDERTDVYALGAILAWMLTGRPTTRGSAQGAALAGPKVRGHRGLAPLLSALLQPDPVDRPRNAGVVVEALEALLGEEADEADQAPAPAPGRAPGGSQAERGPRWRPGWTALAALLVLGALGLGLAGWLARRPAAGLAEAARGAGAVAVLPFEDVSPSHDQAQVAEALSEGLRAALGRVEGLRVPGPSAHPSLEAPPPLLADLGRALGVEAVLEGSVRRSGSRIRITARVLDVASGYLRWTETYDRPLDELPAVEEEIARAVAGALGLRPSPLTRSALPSPSASR